MDKDMMALVNMSSEAVGVQKQIKNCVKKSFTVITVGITGT